MLPLRRSCAVHHSLGCATLKSAATFASTSKERGSRCYFGKNLCCTPARSLPGSARVSIGQASSPTHTRTMTTTSNDNSNDNNSSSSSSSSIAASMASLSGFVKNPFSEAVVSAMRKLYPELHADSSFDNTGLLLEAPHSQSTAPLVLLTNDLTTHVAEEAIARKASIIVSYHSIIFRPIKSLTSVNTQQASLLRLAAAGISVYCPHTAVDASPFGNADWLVDIATASLPPPTGMMKHIIAQAPTSGGSHLAHYPAGYDPATGSTGNLTLQGKAAETHRNLKLGAYAHTRRPITPHRDASESAKGVGYGRYAAFSNGPIPLTHILTAIQAYLRVPASGIALAIPQGWQLHDIIIESIATCGGSGGGIFTKMGLGAGEKADLWITGEVAHHEALYAIENGICVVCLHHSNSERGYLGAVMKPRLEEELSRSGAAAAKDARIELSLEDRDPFGVFTVNPFVQNPQA